MSPIGPEEASAWAGLRESLEIQAALRDNTPKWKAYVDGRDFYFGTAPGDRGKKHYYSHPIDLDAKCQLVVMPESGEDKPETWLYLSAVQYWMKGDAYFTEDLKLSLFDALGIMLAIQEAGAEPPLLPTLAHADSFHAFEGDPRDPLQPLPPEWWINVGGPVRAGGGGRREVSDGRHSGGGGTGQPGPIHRAWPSSGRGSLNGSPLQDRLNGVGPNDVPVGKYPGWDRPHDSLERWQTFRCEGTVYEGYKSDCPDYKAAPLGERWVRPFDKLTQQIAENVQNNIELQRTDPHCLTVCTAVVLLPGFVSALCGAGGRAAAAAPNVYAKVFAVVCAIFEKSVAVRGGAYLGGAKGAEWCEKNFCKPPSGRGG